MVGCRCEILKRMVSSNSFIEGKTGIIKMEDTTYDAFIAFLEYLYTAHCPILGSGDPMNILMLAHRYDDSRLITLCELYISKQIEKAVEKGFKKAEIDIISILLFSQKYNAKQLEAFLLHFISNNYEVMNNRPEWAYIEGENLEYIEEHRWPPLSYLLELETYQKEMKKTGNEDNCVVM